MGNAPDGPGTIQYDTGTFTGVGDIPAVGDNFAFGNVFGPLNLPFTVTNLSIFMAVANSSTTGTGAAFVTVFGALNTAGTNAGPITSPNIAGLNANAFNTVGVNVPFTGTGTSTFLAGVWNPTAGSTAGPTPCANDCVGFDSNAGGQGFNGLRHGRSQRRQLPGHHQRQRDLPRVGHQRSGRADELLDRGLVSICRARPYALASRKAGGIVSRLFRVWAHGTAFLRRARPPDEEARLEDRASPTMKIAVLPSRCYTLHIACSVIT